MCIFPCVYAGLSGRFFLPLWLFLHKLSLWQSIQRLQYLQSFRACHACSQEGADPSMQYICAYLPVFMQAYQVDSSCLYGYFCTNCLYGSLLVRHNMLAVEEERLIKVCVHYCLVPINVPRPIVARSARPLMSHQSPYLATLCIVSMALFVHRTKSLTSSRALYSQHGVTSA